MQQYTKERIGIIIALLLSLLAGTTAQAGTRHVTDSILQQLDNVIARREYYISRKEEELRHMKQLMAVASGETQYRLCTDICHQYDGFCTDSTLRYSLLAEQMAEQMGNPILIQRAQIYRGRCLAINGMYERARTILLPMQDSLYDDNRVQYYRTCTSMYIWEGEFTTIEEERNEAREHIPALRDSILCHETIPCQLAQEEALRLNSTYPRGAIELLRPVLAQLPDSDDNVRYLANTLGSSYEALQMTDSAIWFYARSAISDMEHGIMEHASLRNVALLLFHSGRTDDLERAYRYMSCCIEDAAYCKARLRTIEMAADMPLILDSYQKAIQRQRVRWQVVIALLIVLTIALLTALIFVRKSHRSIRHARAKAEQAGEALRQANEQLQATLKQLQASNHSLKESNRIRSAYVMQYMRECSEYSIKLEEYRQSLLHIATHGNYQQMIDAVRATDIIDENRKVFYQHFDETFLSLFPHFIEQLNSLLNEEQQFELPQQKRLNTELRIFALIRLGIDNSEDIARFLRHSTKTIFNYRASVRGRAKHRDTLEQEVRELR